MDNRSKLALALLGTSSVALGATSVYLAYQLNAERANAQTLHAEVRKLEQRIASAQQSVRVEPQAPVTQQVVTPPAKPSPPATAGVTSARLVPSIGAASVAFTVSGTANPSQEENLRMIREGMERQHALMQNPEYREAMLMQQKAMLPRQYTGLEELLDIGPDRYERLMNTLANQTMRSMDNQSTEFGSSTDPATVERLRSKSQQQQQQNEAELKSVLGDKYQTWKDYQASMSAYQQVSELRSTLAASGLSLEKDQAQALVKTYGDEHQRLMQEYTKDALQYTNEATRNSAQDGSGQVRMLTATADQQERALKRLAESQQRLRDAAGSILTPEQLHQLELEQNQQLQMQEASIRLIRAQADAASSLH